jgi:2-oxoglutarate dehydrogenase E2 component (dihydrolipoamide succinyltransferase)
MATEVKVPPVGESISNGILAVWHVKDGDQVERDQVLFDLETDKITSEGLAEVSGKISLKVKEGDEVDIGQIVAVIDESATASAPTDETAVEADAEIESEPLAAKPSKEAKSVSPAVRRIAAETGIEPAEVEGTGKEGRVTKGDMLQASAPATPVSQSTSAPERQNQSERTTRKKMTGLRRKIADRLVQAQQEAAILTTFNEVDMTAVMNLRKQHQETFVAKYGNKLGFMSFFVKAVVNGLKEVPGINAQIDGQEIVTNHYYDIGIAVGTEKGLVVPVVRDCDQKSFSDIEGDIINYAKKARDGKLAIEDLQGGVFTITNGGIYGSMLSTPILNPPQSAILGMHSIQDRPMAVEGEVVIRPMMYLALSYDHRIVDGKEAVTFLVKVKEAIEDPARLLFEI